MRSHRRDDGPGIYVRAHRSARLRLRETGEAAPGITPWPLTNSNRTALLTYPQIQRSTTRLNLGLFMAMYANYPRLDRSLLVTGDATGTGATHW